MLRVVLIYSDKIKSIFRSWQRRSAVCFGVASAKGKKLQYIIVWYLFLIKLSMEENEWTVSDVFAQINTFLEAIMLSFLKRGGLIEMFTQLGLQWKKNLVQNCATSRLPQTMNNFVSYVNFTFCMSDSFSEEGCHVVISKSNSEETVCSCNHLTHFAVLMDYDGSTKVIKLYLLYWIILWARWTNSTLSFNFSFFWHSSPRRTKQFWKLSPTWDWAFPSSGYF